MKKEPEIYVSTDIEADGPIPGPHSMLSFGSAAYLPDKTVLATFSANLETLDIGALEWAEGAPPAPGEEPLALHRARPDAGCRSSVSSSAAFCRFPAQTTPSAVAGRCTGCNTCRLNGCRIRFIRAMCHI